MRRLPRPTLRSLPATGLALVLALTLAAACGGKKEKPTPPPSGGDDATATTPPEEPPKPAEPAIKSDHGVDVEAKVIKIGALNDESGPAAVIGKPYAAGKRLLAAEINAGGSGILPEGWKVELVEKDHGYNPGQSVQAYNAIKDEVLFIATSFGTPNTLPLRKFLERDSIVAYPASLSSKMAEFKFTPPAGPGYNVEAMRAMDFAVDKAGGAANVKAAIVYQKDDYGADGLDGWKKAAAKHGVTVVSEQGISPMQKDFTAVVTQLKEAGANYVLLTTLPSATMPIIGTAAKLEYMPVWLGNTPAWIDLIFAGKLIPPAAFGNFYLVTGLPYWGEKIDGMDSFLATYDKHGKDLNPPDFYVFMSYLQGRMAVEVAKRAIEAGDVTRAGYLAKLNELDAFTAGGLLQPLDLTKVPYVTATKTRVLQPDFEAKTWKEVAPYAKPSAL